MSVIIRITILAKLRYTSNLRLALYEKICSFFEIQACFEYLID